MLCDAYSVLTYACDGAFAADSHAPPSAAAVKCVLLPPNEHTKAAPALNSSLNIDLPPLTHIRT